MERRSGRGHLRRALVVTLLLLSITVPPGAAQDTQQRLDAARAQRAALQQRLDAAAQRLGEIEAETALITDQITALEVDQARLQTEIDEASDRIAIRVRDLYKLGRSADPMVLFLSGEDPTTALEAASMVRHLVSGDEVSSEIAAAGRVQLRALQQQVEDQSADLLALRDEQRILLENITADLEAAQALEGQLTAQRAEEIAEAKRRAEEEARRRAAEREAAVRANGGYSCPIDRPHSFTDTWGAPRSGGRSHKGTDILAPRGTAVFAIVGGVADIRREGGLAGKWIILDGVDGDKYYYIHLDGYAVGDMARVQAGQIIGFNGDTGNARGTPHTHFEHHPGGGGPTNPYPLLRRLCG